MPNFNVHPLAHATPGRYRFTHKQTIAAIQLVGEADRFRYRPPMPERVFARQSLWTLALCMPKYPGPVAYLQ